ncbi:hypothetical protein C8J57DRAFT_1286477 [Mycena rebaudengoi]|nr:hypothetical protein C8J57DRAFT_1286477 [Mycena rebaudengoi]
MTLVRRRSPPSPLRLVLGPVPPRSQPKHTLPSVPRPAFSQPAMVARGPSPRPHADAPTKEADRLLSAKFSDLPGIVIPAVNSSLPSAVLGAASPSSRGSLRGPWDHSGTITIATLDVESLLTPMKPVARMVFVV